MSNHKRPFPEAEKPKLKQSQSLPMGYCTVYLDQMELPQGDLHPYTRIEFGCDATAVVAITCQNRWIINWEYRYPTKEWLLSIAGGKIDEGEDAVKAAQRELLEGRVDEEPDPQPVGREERVRAALSSRKSRGLPPVQGSDVEPRDTLVGGGKDHVSAIRRDRQRRCS